jgi:hypothetical protein
MNAPFGETTDIPGTHGHAIERLSRELHVPIEEAADVYKAQLESIAASARLHHFVSVIATSRARGILLRSRQLGH